jgi:hypothetical protein
MPQEPTENDVKWEWQQFIRRCAKTGQDYDFKAKGPLYLPLRLGLASTDLISPNEPVAMDRPATAIFTKEYGTQDGQRAYRIIGKVPEAALPDVIVEVGIERTR